MKSLYLSLIVAAIGVVASAADDAADKGRPKAKTLSTTDVAEKLERKDVKAVTVEVTLEPGQAGAPHRHPGPVFGYILEGEYDWAIDDQPVKMLKVGDTFYEPAMCLHRVSKNPSDKNMTRVLAVLLVPRDANQISIPEKKE